MADIETVGEAMRIVFVCVALMIAAWFFSSQRSKCELAMVGDSIFSQMKGKVLPPPFDKACNLGKSGAPSAEIANMVVPASVKTVVIEGGINDVLSGWPDEGIFSAYRKAIASHSGRKVVAVGILPVSPEKMPHDYANYATRERVARVNAEVERICLSFPHCSWIGTVSGLDPERHTTDGIHLNDDGRSAVLMAAQKYLLHRAGQ